MSIITARYVEASKESKQERVGGWKPGFCGLESLLAPPAEFCEQGVHEAGTWLGPWQGLHGPEDVCGLLWLACLCPGPRIR